MSLRRKIFLLSLALGTALVVIAVRRCAQTANQVFAPRVAHAAHERPLRI
jgi:hypothetical protein